MIKPFSYHNMTATTALTLRYATVFCWPWGFALGLAHGISHREPLPAVGIAPLTIATLANVAILFKAATKRTTEKDAKKKDRHFGGLLLVAFDMCIVGAMLGVLMPTWIEMNQSRRYSWNYHGAGAAALGAYATVSMMFVFAIHLMLFCQGLVQNIALIGSALAAIGPVTSSECPNCHHDLRRGQRSNNPEAMDNDGYQPLMRGAEEYRDSMESDAQEVTEGDSLIRVQGDEAA